MVVVGGLPSPWTEAAKGILHIKGIDWAAVRLAYDDEQLKAWAGQRSAPALIYEKERPRHGWSEILLFAERLAPSPALLPPDPAERTLVFGLAHEICGEEGLGWARRLQLIHSGLQGTGGFVEPVARYLGRKYGYTPETGAAAGARVVALLGMLASRLRAQRETGSRFLVGQALTAADIYSATFMAMFVPLPDQHCKMDARTRTTFETLDAPTKAAIDPILLEHRDMVYADFLELPLSL
jgi:glutathione S-transferase